MILVNSESMVALIDWTLDEPGFKAQINKMIEVARQENKVIPLPMPLDLNAIIMLQTNLSCEGCDVHCCRVGDGISLLSVEENELIARHNAVIQNQAMACPCQFLKNKLCSIYADRPLACLLFPFQTSGKCDGEEMMAIASDCPEARRIAKKFYTRAYHFRKKYREIKALTEMGFKLS